jgi:hypothetical protein
MNRAVAPPISKIAQQRDYLAGSTPADRNGLVWDNFLGKYKPAQLLQSDVSGLSASLAAKANLAGGNTFSGNQSFSGAQIQNALLNVNYTGGTEEHTIANNSSGNNTLFLVNASISGYSAVRGGNYLSQEKWAVGYGNPSGVPPDYTYFETSNASVGSGTAPGFVFNLTTDYGLGIPYGQYKKMQITPDGSVYMFPNQQGFYNDPATYNSFYHSRGGNETSFGPDNGHRFQFTHDGFTGKVAISGGNSFDLMYGSQRMRFAGGKWAIGGDVFYNPTATLDVVGTILAGPDDGTAATNPHIVAILGNGVAGFGGTNDANAEYFIQQNGVSYQVNGGAITTYPGVRFGLRKEGSWNMASGGTAVGGSFVVQTSGGGSNVSLPTMADRFIVRSDGRINCVPRAGAPALASEGDFYYDSTDHHLKVWTGAAWKQCDN